MYSFKSKGIDFTSSSQTLPADGKKICGIQVWSQVGRHSIWGKPECIWSNQSSQHLHGWHRSMACVCQKAVTVLHGEGIHKKKLGILTAVCSVTQWAG